ncbi:MAG: DUF4139 domain-containing protein [Dissulfurispiraceae bacterium]
MQSKITSFILAPVLLVCFVCCFGYAEETSSLPVLSTTLNDQVDVAVTIYNANIGLVKDRRRLVITKGIEELKFMDVASSIIPTSVQIKSITSANDFFVLEQNYEYDLINTKKLLDKYVGKELKLYYKNPFTEREETTSAMLLANNDVPIYKIGGEITFGHPGRIILPEIPADMVSRPTLVWLLKNSYADAQVIEATYLTENINWKADYVITLNDKDTRADISGWVSIENNSGTAYKNAKVKLVAGDINRVKEGNEYVAPMMAGRAKAEAPQFKEETFFEYHMYTLQRPTTIKDRQTKQISFLDVSDIPVEKRFICRGERYYYNQMGDPVKQKVGVYIEIENRKENNLGMPLPKGIARTTKRDNEGGLQFIGEDSIDHTPANEKIRIKLGDAFDVVTTRKQTDWKKVAYDTYEAAYEISIRNHKPEDVTVKVLEPIPGEWNILSSSHEYSKKEAFYAEFNVLVPKDDQVTLSYRVRMRY